MTLTVGSLFSGIGGFDLGLERAGMKVEWQVEKDEFCRKVLAKHWPEVPCYEDIHDVADLPYVDVVCGGFPCPVVSTAARGRNNGAWLWPEFHRIVTIVKPKFVLIENVFQLLRAKDGSYFKEILDDLASNGYDATWTCLKASYFKAPHHRARIWMVAYTNQSGKYDSLFYDETSNLLQHFETLRSWSDPPRALRMDDGVSRRLDRPRREALGNALLPQIAEFIGRRILDVA